MHQQERVMARRTARRYLASIAALVSMHGCVDVQGPEPKPLTSSQVFSELRIGAEAVLIAVGDTLQLPVRGIAMDTSEIPLNLAKVTWKTLDSAQVSVDSTGRIVAHTPTFFPVSVIATYTHESTTKSDTIPVVVTSTKVTSPSVRLMVLDSARVGATAIYQNPRIRVDLYQNGVLATQGVQIPLRTVAPMQTFFSMFGGPSGEPVYLVYNDLSKLGRSWIRVAANVYGVNVRDSVEFTGVYPVSLPQLFFIVNERGEVFPNEYSDATPIPNVQPCAFVRVWVGTPMSVDVVFSDSTASTTGCAPIPDELLAQAGYSQDRSFVGSNVYNVPYGTQIIRRSNTVGLVTYYIRDAVTKVRLPVSGRYNAVTVDP